MSAILHQNQPDKHGKPVVVVTRPLAQAQTLCQRIEDAGLEAFCCPTLEIVPLDVQSTEGQALRAAMTQLSTYHLVIFISPNAIEESLRQWSGTWPTITAIGVMGPGSRAVLAQHGLEAGQCKIISPMCESLAPLQGQAVVEAARFDSESLLEQLTLHQNSTLAVPLSAARVLVLRGTHGRDLIVEQLRARGAQVEVVPCYQRRVPVLSPAQQTQWRRLAQQRQVLQIVATSSEGLRNLPALLADTLDADDFTWLYQQCVVAPHVRIVEQARQLGFSSTVLSRPGDENILRKITAPLSETISEATIMTDSSNNHPDNGSRAISSASAPNAAPASVPASVALAWQRWPLAQKLLLLLGLLLITQFFWAQHQMDKLQREVARRTQESQTISRESQSSSLLAQDLAREMQARLGVLEASIAQSRGQQQALEQLYQDLSRSRDEWALSEVEQVLAVASQQLQLAGNVQGAIIALQSVDARLARTDRPQFVPLRRLLARDLERLKALPYVDLVGLSLKIDGVITNLDSLALLADAKRLPVVSHEKTAASSSGLNQRKKSGSESFWAQWQTRGVQLWEESKDALTHLVEIRKASDDDALYLSPEKATYLRENIKLRLLNARIALLSHQEAAYRADLKIAMTALDKYFDGEQKSVQTAQNTLKQLYGTTVTIDLPVLSESLNAVRNFRPSPATATQPSKGK